MAKHRQKKVKQLQCEKRAIKQAANDWMASFPGTEMVAAKQPRIEPAFQVDVRPEAMMRMMRGKRMHVHII
jgi:hypothetical protein